jgi:hypothetical protein
LFQNYGCQCRVQNQPLSGLAILIRTKVVALKLEKSPPLKEQGLKQFQFLRFAALSTFDKMAYSLQVWF